MTYDTISIRGIKIRGKVLYPGLDFPENVTLWCKKKLLPYLNMELDDIYDVISSSPSVLDAREGLHVYDRDTKQLIYITVAVDDESGDYGLFLSVSWIVNNVSVKEANDYKTEDTPLILN